MEPLVVLVVTTAVLLVLGAVGVPRLRPWPVALRGGLAAMFVLTGVAHFVGKRAELVAMVPPALPAPELLVTVTGVLELAGAAGLLWSRTAPWAAGGLAALLVAVFPANVHRALAGPAVPVDDRLVPRTALQVVFLAATLAVVVHHLRATRRATTGVGAGAGPARAERTGPLRGIGTAVPGCGCPAGRATPPAGPCPPSTACAGPS